MPVYAAGTAKALEPGNSIALFNDESPAAGDNSIAVALGANPGGGEAELSFTIAYKSAPTAVLTVMVSDVDASANYVATSQTSTSKQYDNLQLGTAAAFVLIQLTSESAGLPVTVTCHRGA